MSSARGISRSRSSSRSFAPKWCAKAVARSPEMEDDLKNSLLSVCIQLHRSDVRYILVGGVAVALHGYYRHSMGPTGELTSKPDIDLWFEPTYGNYFKLLNALAAIGVDVSEFQGEVSPDPKRSFFKLDLGEFTLDTLPRINADIPFGEAYARKENVALDGIQIHYIGYEDLLKDKQSSARQKDKEDIKHLRRQRGEG